MSTDCIDRYEFDNGWTLETYPDYDPMPPTDWMEGVEIHDISGWSHETERILENERSGLYTLYDLRGWEGVNRWGRLAGRRFEVMSTAPNGAPALVTGPVSELDDSALSVIRQYLDGEVFGVVLRDPDGDVVEACGGYYGYGEFRPDLETTGLVDEWRAIMESHVAKREREAADLADYVAMTMLAVG